MTQAVNASSVFHSIGYFSSIPKLIKSTTLCLAIATRLTGSGWIGCILYSNFEARFRSLMRFFIFVLCWRIIRAFFLSLSGRLSLSSICPAYPITIESGVRISWETPEIQFALAVSFLCRFRFCLWRISEV